MANEKSTPAAEGLAHQIHSAAIHLLRRLRREDAATGLNAPRLSALSVVVFGGPLTLGELAAAEQVRPPTMTRIVSALRRRGLVAQKKSPIDARKIHLSATTRGRALLLQARERRVRALAREIALLRDGQQATLRKAVAILEKVVKRVG